MCPQQSQRITAIPEWDHWLRFPLEPEGAGKTQRHHWDLGFGGGSTGGTQRMTEVRPHGSSLAQLVLGLVHWVLRHINDVAWIFV